MTEPIDAPKDAAVPGIDFGSLLGNPASNPQPASPLEKQLAQVTPQDAAASRPSEAQFSFRTLLTEQQLADLRKAAPAVAEQMAADYNAIIKFSAPVLERLTATSSQLLNAQKDIKIPAAEAIVNDLLREIDGFAKKYRNVRVENGVKRVVNFLRGIKYSLTTLARESRPIADKIDMAEVKLKGMEIKLADNVSRGQTLHKNTLTTLQDVVAVLAALEEITDCVKREFADVDALLPELDTVGRRAGQPGAILIGEGCRMTCELARTGDLRAFLASCDRASSGPINLITALFHSWSAMTRASTSPSSASSPRATPTSPTTRRRRSARSGRLRRSRPPRTPVSGFRRRSTSGS